MSRGRFERSGQSTLDGTGAGQVEFTAPTQGEWHVEQLTVVCTASTPHPEARVYLNAVADTHLIEGTYSGARDTSDTTYVVPAGNKLIVRWTGGLAGATVTARLAGQQRSPGGL